MVNSINFASLVKRDMERFQVVPRYLVEALSINGYCWQAMSCGYDCEDDGPCIGCRDCHWQWYTPSTRSVVEAVESLTRNQRKALRWREGANTVDIKLTPHNGQPIGEATSGVSYEPGSPDCGHCYDYMYSDGHGDPCVGCGCAKVVYS